jgi:hypothetical protein
MVESLETAGDHGGLRKDPAKRNYHVTGLDVPRGRLGMRGW